MTYKVGKSGMYCMLYTTPSVYLYVHFYLAQNQDNVSEWGDMSIIGLVK